MNKQNLEYIKMFANLDKVNRAFYLAQATSGGEGLLNDRCIMQTLTHGEEDSEIKIHTFSKTPIDKNIEFVLTVGNSKEGFYEFPVIKIGDFLNSKVKAETKKDGNVDLFKNSIELEQYFKKIGIEEIESYSKTSALALVPECIGENILMGSEYGKTNIGLGVDIDLSLIPKNYEFVIKNEIAQARSFIQSFRPREFLYENGELESHCNMHELINDDGVPSLTIVQGECSITESADFLKEKLQSVIDSYSAKLVQMMDKNIKGFKIPDINISSLKSVENVLDIYMMKVGKNTTMEEVVERANKILESTYK